MIRPDGEVLAELGIAHCCIEGLKAEIDSLRALVKDLIPNSEETEAPKTGEPVAWRVEYGPSDYGHTDSAERVARAKSQDAKVTPLYEAPPPAAIGVEGERFICIARDGQISVLVLEVEGPVRVIGTLAEATETIASQREPRRWELLRVSSPDAPVVDVAAIRRVVAFMDAAGNQGGLATSLRAAIGEAK